MNHQHSAAQKDEQEKPAGTGAGKTESTCHLTSVPGFSFLNFMAFYFSSTSDPWKTPGPLPLLPMSRRLAPSKQHFCVGPVRQRASLLTHNIFSILQQTLATQGIPAIRPDSVALFWHPAHPLPLIQIPNPRHKL